MTIQAEIMHVKQGTVNFHFTNVNIGMRTVSFRITNPFQSFICEKDVATNHRASDVKDGGYRRGGVNLVMEACLSFIRNGGI